MKILMVNSGVYPMPTFQGGLENVVYALSNNLAERGIEIDLVTDVSENAKFHENINIFKIGLPELHVFQWGFLGYVLRHILGGFLAFRKAKSLFGGHYDAVHVHGRLGPLLLTIFNRGRQKLVYTIHDDSPNRQLSGYLVFLASYKLCIEPAARRASKVIVLHEDGRRHFLFNGVDEKRINVIPNGVNTKLFRKRNLEKNNHCLFVGSLTARKGVKYLLQAMSLIPELEAVVVGDGTERKNLENMASELGINGRIKFLGLIRDSDSLSCFYSQASFLVLPSLTEGLPLVVPEAMACGTPVIASNLPGNAALVRNHDTGFLFEVGNYIDLAEKIKLLVGRSSKCREMGNRAQQLRVCFLLKF